MSFNYYKWLAYLIAFIGFFVGIGMNTHFGAGIMWICWISTLFTFVIIYWLGDIKQQVVEIKEILKNNSKK